VDGEGRSQRNQKLEIAELNPQRASSSRDFLCRRQLGHSWLSMFSRFSIEAMSSVFPIAALKEKALLAF
jgi:hypothetical protein